jgi:hypothetical protein
MLKLNYDEISNVRRVCRRFSDIGNSILNRQFNSLKGCVKRLLADLVKEENALLAKTSEENALLAKTSTETYRELLFRCRETLNGLLSEIKLLRKVHKLNLLSAERCRLDLFGIIEPYIYYSNGFSAGKIIDFVHSILRIVKRRKSVDLVGKRIIMYKWMRFSLKYMKEYRQNVKALRKQSSVVPFSADQVPSPYILQSETQNNLE